jgi:hypothetical protein
MDVGDDDRPPLRRRAAHATAERDADARGLALERPDDQLAAAHEVEARQAEVGHAGEDQRDGVRGIGDRVGLVAERPAQLRREVGVELELGCSDDWRRLENGRAPRIFVIVPAIPPAWPRGTGLWQRGTGPLLAPL